MALKVLAVDDEPDVLRLIKVQLEAAGCDVVAIGDSREAARRVARQKFDGVFVDARMPHLDGFELTRQIRSSPSNRETPIVMLTGFDDAETMRAGFNAGITFFLGKPIDAKKVRGLVAAMRGPMLKEKRRYARLPVRTAVLCHHTLGDYRFKGASVNLGQGGMLLLGEGRIEPGEEFELRFSLPGTTGELNPLSVVVRVEHPDLLAVRYERITPEDAYSLNRFIVGLVKE